MPELPEVETVRLGLQRLLPGRCVVDVAYDWPKGFPNSASDVNSFLIGSCIKSVSRRGKALLINLSTDYVLFIHLKMTGQLVFVEQKRSEEQGSNASCEERFGAGHPNDSLVNRLPDKSTRVTFTFSDGSHLYFNDQRKFGWVKLLPQRAVKNESFIKKLGPEPLEASFTSKKFIQRLLKRPNTSIKAALLDQSVLAGVGNIYADESLWAARIHPSTRVRDVSKAKLEQLHSALIDVLKLSIEKGGSTDRNYVNAEGKKGSYISFAKVFRRDGHPCLRCGAHIEKTRVAGRGTHYCPNCQKQVKP